MILRLLLFSLLLPSYAEVLAQASSNGDTTICSWRSMTPPGALSGNEGASNAPSYWFGHLADVDTKNSKHQFIFQIRNLHADKLLPVEWMRGDGTQQIGFRRISPGGCASNDFETYNGFKEDSKAVIKYGPIKQESKTASLYVLDRSEARKDGPPLRSKLMADIQDPKEENHRLFIELTTEYRDGTFVHTVRNFGSNDEVLRIPALSALRQKNPRLMAIIQWPMKSDLLFVANNERPHSFSFTISGNTTFQETLVPIQVVSTNFQTGETETLATASVVLYLPFFDN